MTYEELLERIEELIEYAKQEEEAGNMLLLNSVERIRNKEERELKK